MLIAERDWLPPALRGAEDLTPSHFYTRDDAERAREGAALVVGLVKPFVTPVAS